MFFVKNTLENGSYVRIYSQLVMFMVATEVVAIPLGMLYFYLATSLPDPVIGVFLHVMLYPLLIKLMVGGLFIRYLTNDLREVIERFDTLERVTDEMVQKGWLEIVNFPVRFLLYHAILFTILIFVIPGALILYLQVGAIGHLVPFLAASVVTTMLLTILQFLVYEYSLDNLLLPYERQLEGRIHFGDSRVIYLTIGFRFKFLAAFIMTILTLFLATIADQHARLILSGEINPIFAMNSLKFEMIFTTILVLFVALGFIYFMSSVSTVSLRYIYNQMYVVKNGIWEIDLIEAHKSVSRDEITDLIGAFYDMMQRLQQFIVKTHEFGEKIADVSDRLVKVSDSQMLDYRQEGRTVLDLQATHNELLELPDEMKRHARKTLALSNDIIRNTGTALETLIQMDRNVASIEKRVNKTRNQMIELDTRLLTIDDTVRDIRKIADQTKVLAFNASIESAAQSELGLRFNVIAEEIRTLTVQVISATDQIKQIVNDTQKSTRNALQSSERELQAVEQEVFSVQTATESLRNVNISIGESNATLHELLTSLDQQQLLGRAVSQHLEELQALREHIDVHGDNTTKRAKTIARLTVEMRELLDSFQFKDNQRRPTIS